MNLILIYFSTVRRAFEDEEWFAEVIGAGVTVELVHRLHMVWIALSCELPISPERFGHFCRTTKAVYVRDLTIEGEHRPWKGTFLNYVV